MMPKGRSVPEHAKALLDALQGMVPAIEAIANGGACFLEGCPSMYGEPPSSEEDDEHLIHLRIGSCGSTNRDPFLDFGELDLAIRGLEAIRARWLQ